MYQDKTFRERFYPSEEVGARPFDELAEIQRMMGQWKYLFKITLDGFVMYTHEGHCVGKLKDICRLMGRKIKVERFETKEPHKFVPVPKGYVPMSMGECLFYVKPRTPFGLEKLAVPIEYEYIVSTKDRRYLAKNLTDARILKKALKERGYEAYIQRIK